MNVSAVEATPFWPAADLQEVLVTSDAPCRADLRTETGQVSVDLVEGHTAAVIATSPGADAVEVRVEGGTWERIAYEPGRLWSIIVMPTSHVDIYSSDTYDKTPAEHAAALDAALDICSRFPPYRYQIENLLPVVEHGELSPGRHDELLDRMRAGQIGVGAQFAGIHHGEASGEELLRVNVALGSRLGLEPNCGYTVDVPAATAQYRQLLARQGIARWIYSPNRFPPPGGFLGVDELIRNLPSIGRAVAPDGSAVTTWIPPVHYGMDLDRFGFSDGGDGAVASPKGAPTRISRMRAAVESVLSELESDGWPLPVYPLEASYGDNLQPTELLPQMIAEWSATYAWPRFSFGTAGDAFDAIEQCGADLPEWSGEICDTWAFLVANQSVLNPVVRHAVRVALASSAAAAALGRPEPDAVLETLIAAAKFEAHDWFYAGEHVMGIPDLGKAAFAKDARAAARSAARSAARAAASAAGEHIAGGIRGALPAFSASGVSRYAVVVSPDGPGQRIPDALVEAAFSPEPTSVAFEDDPATAPGPLFVSVEGFGAFEARRLERGQGFKSEPVDPTFPIETGSYRLSAGPGGIESLFDKELDRELAAGPMGRVQIGTPQNEGFGIGFGLSKEAAQEGMQGALADWAPAFWEPDAAWTGPIFSAILSRGLVGGSPATLTAVLYSEIDRADITLVVEWDGEPKVARFTAGFDFDIDALESVRYEVPFGSVVAGADEAPVGPATLRMAGNWVAFSGSGGSVVVVCRDTGVVALGNRGESLAGKPLPAAPKSASADFVIADTGAPSPLVQPGRLVARFSVASRLAAFSAADAARIAASVVDPMVPVGEESRGWSVAPDNVVAAALLPEPQGDGCLLRLVELDGRETRVELEPPFGPARILDAKPDGSPVGAAAAPLTLSPHEIRTLVVRPAT